MLVKGLPGNLDDAIRAGIMAKALRAFIRFLEAGAA